ncbi:MAG: hypothetical protein WA958_19250 [Tunicatimonas sp.]
MRQTLFILAGLLLGPAALLFATSTKAPTAPGERVFLQTSEQVIGAGETLWLQATLYGDAPRSTVLYAEVLNRSGAVVQGIFLIEDGVGEGQLSLPDTLSGGWYQVRAYTQWMRNEGPATFATQPLLVVNPYEDELRASGQGTTRQVGGAPTKEAVQIKLNKTYYQPREPVVVRWQLTDTQQSARVAVRVRKVSAVELNQRPILPIGEQDQVDSPRFAREDDGLTLSGTVTGMDASTTDRTVILSIPGADPYFEYDFVDQQNRFEIPINRRRQGQQEVVLQTADTTLSTRWSIDEKFAPENTYAQEIFPEVSAAVRAELLAAYTQRSRINAQYDLFRPVDSTVARNREEFRFYGAPNFTVRADDYVALPNFVEVSRELMPGVRLRDRQGIYHFDVFDIPTRAFLEGEPAVFMDGVLIKDVNYLVNFSPREIERIETVNRRTYYGEYRFDGVIAVYTRLLDAYGPALPPTARQEQVTLYTAPQEFAPSDSLAPYEPDFRRLLHWQPSVELAGGAQEITVANADELGAFEVTVEGVTDRGKWIYGRATYTVAVGGSANAKE